MQIQLKAVRDYREEPVFVKAEVTGEIRSAAAADGRVFPAQRCGDGVLVIATMKRGEELELTVSDTAVCENIELRNLPDASKMQVYIGGAFFTEYVYDRKYAKPYLGPVVAADGKTSFTRMDLETQEHPHQRSIICAIGSVNGVDFWNEFGNFGYERHQAYESFEAGAAFASMTAREIWMDSEEKPYVDEKRTYTFYNQTAGCRYVDIEMMFTASYGDVEFGKTKEAGPLGVRMNELLRADHGGTFENSYGGFNEDECWGKPAMYCDYKGTIDGRLYGVAVFDNEKNERYPTTWHIRNYGLFAANNLYFKGGYTLSAGESITYRYRICFYEGEQVSVSDRFNSYVAFSKAHE